MSKILDRYDSKTMKIVTPSGTLFVIIMEDPNTLQPVMIQLHIGKVGSDLRAWTDALAGVINLSLDKGANLNEVIERISNITSDKVRRHSDITIRSGVEGVFVALLRYMQDKHKVTEVYKKRKKAWFKPKD